MQVVPVSQKLIPHIWRFPLYSFDRHQIAQSLLHGGPQLVCKHLLNLKLKVKLKKWDLTNWKQRPSALKAKVMRLTATTHQLFELTVCQGQPITKFPLTREQTKRYFFTQRWGTLSFLLIE